MRNLINKLTVIIVLTVAALPAVVGAEVFWTRSNNSIWEADLGGSNVKTMISGHTNLMDITFDAMNNKLYWTNRSHGIYRANVNGTGVELIVPIENLGESSISINPSIGKVFWTRSNNSIWEADLGGSNAQSVISGQTNLMDITFDAMNNKLYWTNRSHGIYRANANGTGVELIVPIENLSESYIAVDPSQNKVFWTRSNSIWEADLGGNNVQSIISGTKVMDIALDAANNKLYWTNPSWGIYRANIDGTGLELIVPIENLSESYIAVTPEPATLLLLGLGAGMLRRKQRLGSKQNNKLF